MHHEPANEKRGVRPERTAKWKKGGKTGANRGESATARNWTDEDRNKAGAEGGKSKEQRDGNAGVQNLFRERFTARNMHFHFRIAPVLPPFFHSPARGA